jgi:hypothetical protein
MAEEIKNGSTGTDLLAYIYERMRENEEFLHHNASDALGEVAGLINDAIDNVGHISERPEREKEHVERSMSFFMHHVLMPFSYAIYIDLLAANLPVCFMELRLMLESLVKCYLADSKYPDSGFFQERLNFLEQELKTKKWSTSKLMKEFEGKLATSDDFAALWHKLSQDWVHTEGLVNRLVRNVIEKSDIPPWNLVLPMNYAKSDLDAIDKLGSILNFV